MTIPSTKYLAVLREWKKLDEERDKIILHAFRSGASRNQICTATGLKYPTVFNILKRMGATSPPRKSRPYRSACPLCDRVVRTTYMKTHQRNMHES